jgi:hypothetical protein
MVQKNIRIRICYNTIYKLPASAQFDVGTEKKHDE